MVQIGFSTSNMLLSRFIRWVTKAKVSHVWFLFDAYGQHFVLQADIGGITITPLSKWQKKWIIVEQVTLNRDIDLAPAWEMLGEKYDYGGLFGNIVVYIGRWFHKKWKNPLNNSHAMFCSEFVARVLQETNYPGAGAFDPSATSPEDLLEFLKR